VRARPSPKFSDRLLAAVFLALAALLGFTPVEGASGAAIRVAVTDNAKTVEVGGGAIQVEDLVGRPVLSHSPGWIRVAPRDGAVEVSGRRAPGLRLRAAGGPGLRVGSREYPGVIEILRAGDGLLVVNELPLEEYLAGVLKAEASDQWALEMLKAQAIVARTYAAYHRQLNAAKPFHILASTAHQQYIGRVTPSSPAWGAVRETEGQVLLLDGQLFPAFYHTDSGGHTEDPRLVFASNNLPALRGVRSAYLSGSPHFHWSLDLRVRELSELLNKGGVSVGTVAGLQVLERSPSLRVVKLAVRGNRGSVTLRGHDFRRIIGYDTLKSTLFAVAVDGEYARFAGRGYGHGAGMDQWGAKAMAEQGHTARQILEFYYPGATFGSLR
jgi:stage II sporulation protein D